MTIINKSPDFFRILIKKTAENSNYMYTFNKYYLRIAISLFIVEILIALYARDQIIRPYGGDFLVVILIYCTIKSFTTTDYKIIALITLIFSFLIEFSQYFHLINLLGLQNSKIIRIIIGDYFAWTDILAYSLGILTVFCVEYRINDKKSRYLQI